MCTHGLEIRGRRTGRVKKGPVRLFGADLLVISLAFMDSRSLLRVRRDHWLLEIGLVLNKGTQSKLGCAP